MIAVHNVKKAFDKDVILKNINLNIQNGEIFGLVGRSGQGKTTLLRCMNGLVAYDSGEIIIDDKEVSSLKGKALRVFRKDVGMIFQSFSLMERKNVYYNVALPMVCWKYSKRDIDTKVKQLLKVVGLEDKMYSRVQELSGGERQRVAIARTLTTDPKILLSDEATASLDPSTTYSILKLLKNINELMGITIVLVTHEMEVVKQICNRIAVLENGTIAAQGDTQELFIHRPPAIERLLGEEAVTLPQNGKNYRLIFKNTEENNFLLPDMAKSLPVRFSIVSNKQETFRDDIITTAIINSDLSNSSVIEDYLNTTNKVWEVL